MSTGNGYLDYKRDTKCFLHWLGSTNNQIISSASTDPQLPLTGLKSSGKFTLKDITEMVKRVSQAPKHETPSMIFRLLRWSIKGRKAAHARHVKKVAERPDQETEKSNTSHKNFIDCLESAFESLGGLEWQIQHEKEADKPYTKVDVEEFHNRFAALQGSQIGSGSSSGNTSSTSSPIIESFGALSLGDFRIVEDDNELELDYSMAADSMFEEWKCLRAYVQDLWHQVAYRNLNSAIAATMSEIAIKMVKKTELNIFVDFPNGYDAFEKVMNKFAENEENAHEVSSANLQTDSTADSSDANAPDDIAKEMMSGHMYADFLDFFKDFQKNQNGRPSKKMAKRLKTWNSHLDLRVASDAERIEWRRLYTMKWLYDLVNVYAYTVLNSNLRPDNQKAYREQDWTDKIPHEDNKDLSRLFGCEEFACFVTTLAMSKPAYHGDNSSELSRRIDPHRVFQLQSIVDSFMVSRGWSLGPEGHIVSSIVSTVQFSSDLGRLLGIFTRGAEWLSRALMVPAFSSAPSCNQDAFDRIFAIMEAWMGNSERVFDSAAASQFAPSKNGLWDYSPFICGAGLAEGLELVYRMSMLLWDEIPHPTLVIHLHNMCVKKGYLEQPRDLLQALENTFTAAFYKSSIVPDQDFHRQFPQLLAMGRRESLQPIPVNQSTNLVNFLSLEHNTRFKKLSNSMYHRESRYAPEPKTAKTNNSDQDQFLTLQILQSGVEEDFIDPDRLSNRNYLSITLACMMVLHDLNDYLGNAENCNPMRGRTHDWVELTEWILQEEEGWEGCLEAVARALENSKQLVVKQQSYW